MKSKGKIFSPMKVDNWMDCGNKNSVVDTNKQILNYVKEKENLISKSSKMENSIIIPPCYIGDEVEIKNSKIGPFVSIGKNTKVKSSNIENSLIQCDTNISNANLENSMLGNNANYKGKS